MFFGFFILWFLIVLVIIGGIIWLIVWAVNSRSNTTPQNTANYTQQRIQQLRQGLTVWQPTSFWQLSTYYNSCYSKGFAMEKTSGVMLDQTQRPMLAFAVGDSGGMRVDANVLACTTHDMWQMRIQGVDAQVWKNGQFIGRIVFNQGVFDMTNRQVGRVTARRGADVDVIGISYSSSPPAHFEFGSGLKGFIPVPGDRSAMFQSGSNSSKAFNITQGQPNQWEQDILIPYLLMVRVVPWVSV